MDSHEISVTVSFLKDESYFLIIYAHSYRCFENNIILL